ncbi:MAG: response regulator transcription factor [Bdellovibrionales bacterium]|nr:response regulator transcription factor [Bdellovibrionales bacterium]
MAQILVLEDQDDSFRILESVLGYEHQLLHAKTISEAKNIYNNKIELLVLDVGLPDGDGYEFCNWVRSQKNSDVPIVFVSAKSSTESCVTAFTAGGDDYIYKPFHPSELLARITAKLRSSQKKSEKSLLLDSNGVILDLSSQKAYLSSKANENELSLTPIEFKLLHIFLKNPERAIPRNTILDEVWGKDIYVYPRCVDTHISKLRKKLLDKGSLITSVHGRGYRFGNKVGA